MFEKLIIFLLVVFAAFNSCPAISVSADEQDCPEICPANCTPLCATNGKTYKEFSNTCELKTSNCRLERASLQKYVATSMEWCSTELIADLDQLMGKFENLDLESPECMKPCPMIYSPVCVSNGKYRIMISNECIADGLNCALAKKESAVFRTLKTGSC